MNGDDDNFIDVECTQPDEATRYLSIAESTQLFASTLEEGVGTPVSEIWGILKRKDGLLDVQLWHRIKDNLRDTFTLGRSRQCDVHVDDTRVSSKHCMVYCDYSQARLRVFIEDTSVNGTFINDSSTRLVRGERAELKSGDEIFLISPKTVAQNMKNYSNAFLFVNLRERMVSKRVIAPAPQRSVGTSNIDDSANDLATSKHIEDFYVIGDQLGSGVSGQVHVCLHRASGVHCAVKIIDTKIFSLTPGLSPAELREEATMMQSLDHPNIVKIRDTFETDSVLFIVMELVKGGDLFDRIVDKGRYSEAEARNLMRKILSAVEYLHSRNIIHRDLKPENILVADGADGLEIKITDFGLAKKASREGLKTFCGTPQYFAPEVLKRKSTVKGNGRYGTAADMWSVGVIMYILLSGTFPFSEENLLDQIQRAHFSFTGAEWIGVSEAAKHLIKGLMTLRADHRLNVHQALSHPWMTEAGVVGGAVTGRGESDSQHESGVGKSKSTLQQQLSSPKIATRASVRLLESEEKLKANSICAGGSTSSGTGSSRKSSGETFPGSAVETVSVRSMKPPIGKPRGSSLLSPGVFGVSRGSQQKCGSSASMDTVAVKKDTIGDSASQIDTSSELYSSSSQSGEETRFGNFFWSNKNALLRLGSSKAQTTFKSEMIGELMEKVSNNLRQESFSQSASRLPRSSATASSSVETGATSYYDGLSLFSRATQSLADRLLQQPPSANQTSSSSLRERSQTETAKQSAKKAKRKADVAGSTVVESSSKRPRNGGADSVRRGKNMSTSAELSDDGIEQFSDEEQFDCSSGDSWGKKTVKFKDSDNLNDRKQEAEIEQPNLISREDEGNIALSRGLYRFGADSPPIPQISITSPIPSASSGVDVSLSSSAPESSSNTASKPTAEVNFLRVGYVSSASRLKLGRASASASSARAASSDDGGKPAKRKSAQMSLDTLWGRVRDEYRVGAESVEKGNEQSSDGRISLDDLQSQAPIGQSIVATKRQSSEAIFSSSFAQLVVGADANVTGEEAPSAMNSVVSIPAAGRRPESSRKLRVPIKSLQAAFKRRQGKVGSKEKGCF